MTTQIRTETLNHMTVERAYPEKMEHGAKAIADAGDVAKELSKNRGRGFAGDRSNDPKWYTLGNVITGGILGYVAKTYSRNAYTGMSSDEMREVGAKGIHWHSRALGRAHLQATNELPKAAQNLNRYMAADYNFGYLMVNLFTLGHAARVNNRRAKDAQCDMPKFFGDVNETRPKRLPYAEERAQLMQTQLLAVEKEEALSHRDVYAMIKDQKIASSRLSRVRDELTDIDSRRASGAQAQRDGEDNRTYLNRISTRDGSPELRSTYRECLAEWGDAQLSDVDFLEWSMPKLDQITKDADDDELRPEEKAGFTTFELAAIKYNYASYDAGDHARTINAMGIGQKGNRIEQALNRVDDQYMQRYVTVMEDLNSDHPPAQRAALATLKTMRDEAVKIPHEGTMRVMPHVQKIHEHAMKMNEQVFIRFMGVGGLDSKVVAAAGGDPTVADAFNRRLTAAKDAFKARIIEEFPATPGETAQAIVDQAFKACDDLSPGLRGNESKSTHVLDHAIGVAEKTMDGMIDAYDDRSPDGNRQTHAAYVEQLSAEGFVDDIADHWAGLNIENVSKFQTAVGDAKEKFQERLMQLFPGTSEKNAQVVANDVYKASDNLALGYQSKPSKSEPVLKACNYLVAKVIEGQLIIQDRMRAHHRTLCEMGVSSDVAWQATKDAFKGLDTLHWRDKANPAKRDEAMAKADKAAAKQLSRLTDLRDQVCVPMEELLVKNGHATDQAHQFGDQLFRTRAAQLDRLPESNSDVKALAEALKGARAQETNAFHLNEAREEFPPSTLKLDGTEQQITFHPAALKEMSAAANVDMNEHAMQIAAEPISEKLAIDVRGDTEFSICGHTLPRELADLRDSGGDAAVQQGVQSFLQRNNVIIDERHDDTPLNTMTKEELASATFLACQEIGAEVQRLCNAIHTPDANLRPTDLNFSDGSGGRQTIKLSPYFERQMGHPDVGRTILGKFTIEFENTSDCGHVVDSKSKSEDPLLIGYATEGTSTIRATAVVDTNKPIGQQVEYTEASLSYSVVPA
ncbi:MAG: hypothetical protein AAF526_07610, partial [Pseudomonadota bacterium]